ncbi:anti-sigma factor [Gemmatimonas sp.]|jgi:anti-sigma factor (TIGR02949 family)|uniref:anti-sigma factor n=1 Tax=Gemmatimonas sp. TaxID=1962908 RepID=UPI0025BC987E|nr:zf-HC2 domain-containing protein [Gemmatimonas sp.]MCA2986256.1 zf-HC2 domain-containing protein [Gemmatimonas sp.]
MKPDESMRESASMLDCESVMRQLWDYLDRQLTSDTLMAIARHLDDCSRCRPHADYRRAFETAVAGARVDAGDTSALSDRIRLALRTADDGAA